MMQIPNYPCQCQQVPAPSYNAVKIDVHNPSLTAPGMQAPNQSQYATPTMPYYAYPQTQLYDYPQAQQQPYYMPQMAQTQAMQPNYPNYMPQMTQQQGMVQPPYYMPQAQQVQPQQQAQTMVCQPLPQTNNTVTSAPQAPAAAPQPIAVPPVPQPQVIEQQNFNAPQPVVTAQAQDTAPANIQKPEIVEPENITPQIDINSFISRLANPDFEAQAATMEEIANMVKNQPQQATELLDAKIIDALANIMNADSSKLAGPSDEQIAVRQKLLNNEKLSDAEQTLASTITPMEQAERNKSYAMFTTAILQKLYKDEIAKLTGNIVPLTEMPGAVPVVEQLKNNPNPMVRASAIEALSYIQCPEYKKDLETMFNIALNDEDKSVQEASKVALEKLNTIQA